MTAWTSDATEAALIAAFQAKVLAMVALLNSVDEADAVNLAVGFDAGGRE